MKIHAYLIFDGNCAEAFTFYAQCLGGAASIMPVSENAECAGMFPADQHHRTLHACLTLGDQLLMGSDTLGDQPYDGIKGCHVSIQVGSIAEAERVFAALSAGGEVQMALEKTFWAVRFGMLKDRFGVPWMINCEADNASA
ncbi:VOC family protein [Pseudomonas sp. PDM14]|uniref:VOC family protein n=1 Tax=Pseudomonas sp. PDM14 TaxID=2769288 RepID=UPI00177C1E60|nr:VOC family protein [Pseudomonas sp. PDM14]MBD9481771.1 VOC family protein [Pseudomonas sp. PDM14]